MNDIELSILLPAFLAGLLVLTTHIPFGMRILQRGVIFADHAVAEKVRIALLLMVFGTSLAGAAPAASADTDPAPDFQVGERLPATEAVAQPGRYRKMNWDDLIPADWDPMAAIKGLDISKLQDSDPRAMEALDKVRAAWNDAPVVSGLNGVRIEIPGFVVPLDVNPDNLREFLLVPYYGACIHVPPPPSNQVVHAILPGKWNKEDMKALKTALQRYGAIVVSGTLETVSANTSMGFSGYRLKPDRIDPYIEPKGGNRRK